MDTQTAFWEIVREVGSSPEEFHKLCIIAEFKSNGQAILSCARVGAWRRWGVQIENNDKKVIQNWSFAISFFTETLDFHDPESFDKLANFVDQVRYNRGAEGAELNSESMPTPNADDITNNWQSIAPPKSQDGQE